LVAGLRAVAGLHQCGRFEVILSGAFEGRAAQNAIDEVPLEGVDAVAGKALAGVRVVQEAGGLPEEFKGEVPLEIEFDVTLAAVESD
jgi:hypothetical protein